MQQRTKYRLIKSSGQFQAATERVEIHVILVDRDGTDLRDQWMSLPTSMTLSSLCRQMAASCNLPDNTQSAQSLQYHSSHCCIKPVETGGLLPLDIKRQCNPSYNAAIHNTMPVSQLPVNLLGSWCRLQIVIMPDPLTRYVRNAILQTVRARVDAVVTKGLV